MLTSSDVARGKLVGAETLNGAPVKRYVINGDAFLAAAMSRQPRDWRSFERCGARLVGHATEACC